jgi:hypothetical protein
MASLQDHKAGPRHVTDAPGRSRPVRVQGVFCGLLGDNQRSRKSQPRGGSPRHALRCLPNPQDEKAIVRRQWVLIEVLRHEPVGAYCVQGGKKNTFDSCVIKAVRP